MKLRKPSYTCIYVVSDNRYSCINSLHAVPCLCMCAVVFDYQELLVLISYVNLSFCAWVICGIQVLQWFIGGAYNSFRS